MKRWLWVLLACMLTAMGAAALAEIPESDTTTPRLGIAVAAPGAQEGTVPMYAIPDPQGEVLMNYFSGAQLEVVGMSKEGMVQVQAGEKGASIMGYMKENDLRYGAQAVREVPYMCMIIDFKQEQTAHTYCDKDAPVLEEVWTSVSSMAMGRNDAGWVQLCKGYDMYARGSGFVKLPADDEYVSCMASPWLYRGVPLEGEMTQEQAIARAIELVLERPAFRENVLSGLPEDMVTKEGLEACYVTSWFTYSGGSGKGFWFVYFEDPDKADYNLTVEIEANGELRDITRTLG